LHGLVVYPENFCNENDFVSIIPVTHPVILENSLMLFAAYYYADIIDSWLKTDWLGVHIVLVKLKMPSAQPQTLPKSFHRTGASAKENSTMVTMSRQA